MTMTTTTIIMPLNLGDTLNENYVCVFRCVKPRDISSLLFCFNDAFPFQMMWSDDSASLTHQVGLTSKPG